VLRAFSGSGKTTLLNRALRDPAMARTMIVVNEFGEIQSIHALTAASMTPSSCWERVSVLHVFGDLVQTSIVSTRA